MNGQQPRLRLVLPLALALSGCGDSIEKGTPPPWAITGGPGIAPPPAPAPPAPGPSAAPAAAPKAAAAGAPATTQPAVAGQAPLPDDPSRTALLSKLKERKWSNEDFIEGETNRDPFHPFLVDIGQGELPTPQYEILMSKYSLDEIKLQAIVGPPTWGRGRGGRDARVALRALFVDPSGMGHSVVRGNHISKADAQVFRIDSEKYQVIVRLREELGNGKQREVERVLELYQGPEAGNP